MKFLSNVIKPKLKRGFTLIELLVVLAIFIVITSVVLARQNRFSSDILLSDVAYQIAISIRQAQVYGLGVRSVGGVTKGVDITYDTGYGIHFEGPLPASSYIFFPDLNKNGIADVVNGTLETSLSTPGTISYDLSRGQKIVSVCATNANGNGCLSGLSGVKGGSGNASSLNVIYIRPDPTAKISDDQGVSYNTLVITVASSLGDRFKCITAYGTGQVSVSNPTGILPNPCISSNLIK